MKKYIVFIFSIFLSYYAYSADSMKISLERGDKKITFYDGKIHTSIKEIMNQSPKINSGLEKSICFDGTYIIEITENSKKRVYEIDNGFFYFCVIDNVFYRGDLLNNVRDLFFLYLASSEENFENMKLLFFQ